MTLPNDSLPQNSRVRILTTSQESVIGADFMSDIDSHISEFPQDHLSVQSASSVAGSNASSMTLPNNSLPRNSRVRTLPTSQESVIGADLMSDIDSHISEFPQDHLSVQSASSVAGSN